MYAVEGGAVLDMAHRLSPLQRADVDGCGAVRLTVRDQSAMGSAQNTLGSAGGSRPGAMGDTARTGRQNRHV